jgi:Flp pilus assembly pilin Flp
LRCAERAALIAFAAVARMNYVAQGINNAFSKIGNKLNNAIS